MFILEYPVRGRSTLRQLYGPFYFNAPCGSLVPKDSLIGIKFVVFSYRSMRTAFPMFLWLLNMITLTAKIIHACFTLSFKFKYQHFFKIISIFYFWHESWISYPKHSNKNHQLSAHLKVIVIAKFQLQAGKIKWLWRSLTEFVFYLYTIFVLFWNSQIYTLKLPHRPLVYDAT